MKEERANSSLEAQRALREVETKAAADAKEHDGYRIVLEAGGSERRQLPARLCISLVEGAEQELSGTASWGIPPTQVAEQALLWADGRERMIGDLRAEKATK